MYYGMFGGLDGTYILVIIGALISMIASASVKSSFNKYAKIANSRGISGAEAARRILKAAGCYDVEVVPTSGSLTDNYNPGTKRLNLSEPVYGSVSISAVGVAAHECGHAMQHNEGYFPLKLRSLIVPIANFGSKLGIPMILIGLFISYMGQRVEGNSIGEFIVTLGIILFSFGMIFQIITLPVEFNASRRAIAVISEMDLLGNDELSGAKKVLKSAAMTYVAAAASSILSLLRIILIFGGGGKKRR